MWTCPFSNTVWAHKTPKGKSFPLLHLSGRGHLSGWTWGYNEVNDGREGEREGRREEGGGREEGEEIGREEEREA